ncbi:MAG: TlpA family protein disulfide reductase [Flavobacteriales bacterium]|nr:TlpA family protein disulfide reductase [Flavobacteriales bacterium]
MRLTLIAFLLFTLTAFGENVIIKGGIKGFEGKEISANIYEDYITFNLKKLNTTTIKNGEFQLTFNLNEVEQIVLKIENKSTSLFAEPAETYNIGLDYDAIANQGKAFDKFLNIHFLFPKPNETNSLIKSFNTAYQNFFADNYQKFAIKQAYKETNAFIKKIENKPQYQSKPFVRDYVKYAIANLKDINNVSDNELFNNYLNNKPILYRNKEYMNFFVQFYKSDFDKLTIGKNGQAILKTITFDKSLAKSIEAIKSIKKIEQDELAELYLLYGLFDVFHIKRVNQDASLNLIAQIEKNGQSVQNKILAKNLKNKLKLFGFKQIAPDFNLQSNEGKSYTMADFKGKVVYLNFWANWSIPSLREMQVIKMLYEKYADKIYFVSINLDENKSSMLKAQNQFNFPWTILYGGEDFELRERFEVKAVPSYFLIDENGKMLQAFSPGPADMDKRFHEMK